MTTPSFAARTPAATQPSTTSSASIVRQIVAEHRTLLYFCAAYLCAGGTTLLVLGRPWPLRLTTPLFATAWAAVSLLWLGFERFRSPGRRFRDIVPPNRVGGAVLVAVILVPLQVTFQSLKQSIGPLVGFGWDGTLSRIDIALHGGQPWIWGRALLDVPAIRGVMDWLYMGWFVAVFLFAIWLSWTSRRRLRQQALLAFVGLWALGGTVMAALLSSAGPVYQPQYAELARHLTGTIARANQVALLKASLGDVWLAFGGISAMPSMHVGTAVVMALALRRRHTGMGILAWTYALVIQAASVLLGWHYAIDGYVAAAVALGCWGIAGRLSRQVNLREAALVQASLSL